MSVSILVPGFRPTFLRQTIGSILAQDVEDLEILISDDSGSDALQPVLERFGDPRIRVMQTTGRIGAPANCAALWRAARYDLIKFVFDDDLLMPHALPTLLSAAEQFPDASFWFGTRQVIDSRGLVRVEASPLQKPVVQVGAGAMATSMLPRIVNPLGEFTNVMMNRRVTPDPASFLEYEGLEIRVLGEIAYYFQATRRANAIGMNRCIASFRRHDRQQSSVDANPSFVIGLAEWEIFLRGERMAGTLDEAGARAALGRLSEIYRSWLSRFPALGPLLSGLPGLEARLSDRSANLLDDAFRACWQAFITAVPLQPSVQAAKGL